MFKTKCGCPYCKGQPIPAGRWQWKGRTNKRGHRTDKSAITSLRKGSKIGQAKERLD